MADESQQRFNKEIQEVADEILELLRQKNLQYGDAMLSPVSVFSDLPPVERIKARLDEKLARIIEGCAMTDDEDTVMDLIGILIILRVAQKRKERGEKEAKAKVPKKE